MTNLTTQTPEQRPFRGDKGRTFGMVIRPPVLRRLRVEIARDLESAERLMLDLEQRAPDVPATTDPVVLAFTAITFERHQPGLAGVQRETVLAESLRQEAEAVCREVGLGRTVYAVYLPS
jgi:hypothetical protein